jgi:hypothetical protein
MHDVNAPLLAEALFAARPAPDRAAKMVLYGRFVGSRDGKVVVHEDGGRRESSTEVDFGWALGGRAVHDVWIAPSRHARKPTESDRMYGTTLRVYDPRSDAWDITWIDPRQAGLRSHDRTRGRRGYRSGIPQPARGPLPVALHRDHGRLVSLDLAGLCGRGRDLERTHRIFPAAPQAGVSAAGVTARFSGRSGCSHGA